MRRLIRINNSIKGTRFLFFSKIKPLSYSNYIRKRLIKTPILMKIFSLIVGFILWMDPYISSDLKQKLNDVVDPLFCVNLICLNKLFC